MARFKIVNAATGRKITTAKRNNVGRKVNSLREDFPFLDIVAIDTAVTKEA